MDRFGLTRARKNGVGAYVRASLSIQESDVARWVDHTCEMANVQLLCNNMSDCPGLLQHVAHVKPFAGSP